jgi:hypothetical protein
VSSVAVGFFVVGAAVGFFVVGADVGFFVVGADVGFFVVGAAVGFFVGDRVPCFVSMTTVRIIRLVSSDQSITNYVEALTVVGFFVGPVVGIFVVGAGVASS